MLPGLDPLGDWKNCQDLVFYEVWGEIVLMGIMDGHGSWGKRVVTLCKRVCQAYFQANFPSVLSNPSVFLQSLCLECQNKLTAGDSGVNCSLSGTTAVFAVVTKGDIYLATLGDSRGVLGTTVLPVPAIAANSQSSFSSDLLSHIRAIREVIPCDMKAAPLTTDQKPEDPEEAARIVASGGEIRKALNNSGIESGPSRVWRPNEGYPGLAMSRSLGDSIAHTLGVIAEPVLTHIPIRANIDKFLVLASDGVWDVMSNDEVCAFIDQNRAISASEKPKNPDIVHPSEVPIAQLLCEEARTRWLSVVEAEDTVVDDISCIVLELTSKKALEPIDRPSRLELTEVVRERRNSFLVNVREPGAVGTPETPETALFAFKTHDKS